MATRLLMIAFLLGAVACGESDGGTDVIEVIDAGPSTPDASAADMAAMGDMGSDTSPEVDAAVDAGPVVDALPDAQVGPPQPAPTNTLERVVVENWMRGMPPSGSDPLFSLYERGQVEYPEATATGDENGVRWFVSPSTEDGTLDRFGTTEGYAVAQIPMAPHERLVIRADRASQVWGELNVQPGDFYGSGKSLAPVLHQGDQAVVAVLANPRRGAPRLKLYKTTDEVAFNVDDLTVPDLLVGHDEALPVGVPVLNLLPTTLSNFSAHVVENEHFHATERAYPGLPPGSASQVAFDLRPKQAWAEAEVEIPVTIRIEAPGLHGAYERTLTLTTVDPSVPYRRSFISPVDGSVQYYGVQPPTVVSGDREYALVLSLHGAGVEAIGQARAYSARPWNYVIAATNRRPFGFDWEEWGRLNALATLDHAMASFTINPTQVYLTGHSMGGHGTWHVGVTTPGRFATLGPSAGWESFYSYGGSQRPSGPVARARAHSDTLVYLSNIANRGVFIIHGTADDNVPIREGRNMFAAAGMHTLDIEMHEEEGAGHWWNGDEPGADCVNLRVLFQFMKTRRLDPWETDFHFKSPSPSYSADHSFVRIESALSPNADVEISSQRDGNTVLIETENVRSLRLDGAALTRLGVETVQVDDVDHAVVDEAMYIGPREGKRADLYGPFNQAFRRPFCFIYTDDESQDARTAAFYTTYWALIGNGHACGLTGEGLTQHPALERNLIRMGPMAEAIRTEPFGWDDDGIIFGDRQFPNTALMYVYPEGERLSAALVGSPGSEHFLRRLVPFSSRGGLPDYLIFGDGGASALGFFGPDWNHDPAFGLP